MGSGAAGILGFISGFAGSKADEADLLAKEGRAEALRLRKEESALIKERRILKIRGDFATSENTRLLEQDGLLNPDGTVKTEGLEPGLAEQANPTNIRQIMKEQRAINEKRRVKGEKTTSVGPGTLVLTEAEKQNRLAAGGGAFTTEARPPTRGQLNSEFSGVKTAALNSIKNQGGNFRAADRKILASSNLSELGDTGSDEALAYRSMIASHASDLVIRIKDSEFSKNPSAFVPPTSSQLIEEIKHKGIEVDTEFQAATNLLQDKMQQEMDDNPTQKRDTLARRLINEVQTFTASNGKTIRMSPKKRLQEAGLWHETMQDIMFNTLTSVKGVIPEEPGFIDRILK